jgi:hypothetical protein
MSFVPKFGHPAVHCMKEERAVIRSLSAEGPPAARRIEECECAMGTVLFCSGMSTSGVFKNGCTNVKLEEGAGRLSKSITDENIERVRD